MGRGVQRTGPQVVVGTDANLQNWPASQASETFSTSDRQASQLMAEVLTADTLHFRNSQVTNTPGHAQGRATRLRPGRWLD